MGLKAAKVAPLLEGLEGREYPAHYLGWFRCFNSTRYYEAHDVLEELWQDNGKAHENFAFYKGLIQVAGAFVHLKLQFEHPDHHIHGKRLSPSRRLFELSFENLGRYPSPRQGLDLVGLRSLLEETYLPLIESNCTENPWNPDSPPRIPVPGES